MQNLFERCKRIIVKEKLTSTLALILIALIFLMSYINPRNFPTLINARSMLGQTSCVGVFTMAQFITMISGGINLSVVATGNLAAAGMAVVTNGTFLGELLPSDSARIVVGVFIALIIGVLCGLINSFFVCKLKLAPVLVTLSTFMLFEGIATLFTRGGSILGGMTGLIAFGNGAVFGIIPNVFIIMVVCYIAVALFANNTKYGENARLLGANETANRYCGNNNSRTLLAAYIISGVLSSIGGLIVFFRLGVVRAEYGITVPFQTILILVFAGMFVVGGSGKVVNALLAMLILQIVQTGLNMGNIIVFVRNIFWGVMLLVIVVLNTKTVSEFFHKKMKKWSAKNLAQQKAD